MVHRLGLGFEPRKQMSIPRPQLRALTGLRFFAAVHVVVFHFSQRRFSGWAANIVSAGYIGVSLFFVLSGFILAYTYAGSQDVEPIDRRSFWVARFARVYPLYGFALLATLPFFIREVPDDGFLLACMLSTVVLGHAWFPQYAEQWNGPGWSLSVEALFYAAFPFLVPGLRRLRKELFFPSMFGLAVLALAAPFLYLQLKPDGQSVITSNDHFYWLSVLKYNPLMHLPEFLMGALCGVRFLDSAADPRDSRWSVVSTLASVAILAALAASPQLPFPYLHNGLMAPLFCLLIFSLAHDRGPIAAILGTRLLLLLGEASYALYLLHVPIERWLHRFWPAGPSDVWFPVAYGVAVIVLPVVVLIVVENPSRRVLRSWLNRGMRLKAVSAP